MLEIYLRTCRVYYPLFSIDRPCKFKMATRPASVSLTPAIYLEVLGACKSNRTRSKIAGIDKFLDRA